MAAPADAHAAEVIQLGHRLRAADGTDRWFSRRITAMRRDHQGHATALIGVLRDITAATAAEQLAANRPGWSHSPSPTAPRSTPGRPRRHQRVIDSQQTSNHNGAPGYIN